jgi:hypothetical protein
MKDGKFVVVKPIPLAEGKSIRINTEIDRIHGNFYMDGGLLPLDYQQDFAKLVEHEMRTGWKYLRPNNPIVGKSIIGNK